MKPSYSPSNSEKRSPQQLTWVSAPINITRNGCGARQKETVLVYILLAQSAYPSQLLKIHVSIITQRKTLKARCVLNHFSHSTFNLNLSIILIPSVAMNMHSSPHHSLILHRASQVYALNSGTHSSLKPSFINSKTPVPTFPPISFLS